MKKVLSSIVATVVALSFAGIVCAADPTPTAVPAATPTTAVPAEVAPAAAKTAKKCECKPAKKKHGKKKHAKKVKKSADHAAPLSENTK